TAPAAAAPATPGGKAVHEGIAVELQVDPLQPAPGRLLTEGDDAAIRFKISDQTTGNPVAGAYPSAWLDLLRPGESAGDQCAKRIGELLGSDLFNRPALDLNVYYVLALNQDATISVVDPLFGFGGTKLLAMVQLDSPGEDWVLSPDKTRLFVSLPDSGRVAVVDAASWKVISRIDLGGRPRRLAWQPDGAYLWVGLDAGGIAAIRTADLAVAARIATGAGAHDLAVAGDNRFVFVTNREARTLSVVDVAKLAKVRDVPLSTAPTAVAYSSQAQAAYVASEEDGVITAVAAEREVPLAHIQSAPGIGSLRFAPGGRFAFVPNPRADRVFILDAAANRIVQTAAIDGGPDQIDFSDTLAYVRRRGSETLVMIPLGQIGEAGKDVPLADTPGGQSPFGKVSRPSPADSIVRAPGETAVLIANPGDRAIYYYREGMAAPMGSFANYDREPRAVLVVDRTLKERRPGTYETVAKAPLPGRYRVAFFLDAPRTLHCFELAVAAAPELE
ncbi:MAG: YncE family protein, partial [Thermoanaerobaculia bacterium]